MQAAILLVKLQAFREYELEKVNHVAKTYTELLENLVVTPAVKSGYYSSWAQYSILLQSQEQRNRLQAYLKENGVPSMIYYQKPMHLQNAFQEMDCTYVDLGVTEKICQRVLSLPIHPYMEEDEIKTVVGLIKNCPDF